MMLLCLERKRVICHNSALCGSEGVFNETKKLFVISLDILFNGKL